MYKFPGLLLSVGRWIMATLEAQRSSCLAPGTKHHIISYRKVEFDTKFSGAYRCSVVLKKYKQLISYRPLDRRKCSLSSSIINSTWPRMLSQTLHIAVYTALINHFMYAFAKARFSYAKQDGLNRYRTPHKRIPVGNSSISEFIGIR